MNNLIKTMAGNVAGGRVSRRKFMQSAAAAGLTASAASTLLAGSASAADAPKKGGTLKMGLGGGQSTSSLDPALSADRVTFLNLHAFGEKLVDVNGDGSLDMRLASEVEPSDGGKTWAFTIRQGVEFHNGKTVTPDDVLATMERHSDKDSNSGALGIMKGIESMKVDGDKLIVSLAHANADLPYLMSDYHLIIQPNGGKDKPDAGIGAGAYKVDSYEAGVRQAFTKFDNYWDDNRGHFDAVEMLVINDSTARNSALQSGQVHVINQIAPKVASLLGRAPGVTVEHVAGPGQYVFVMEIDKPPFDNNDLRMALKLAINREEMVKKILRGYGSVGNDFPINSAYPLFDDSIPQRKYDAAKAAEYYKKSGHDGSPIVLKVAEAAFPGAVDAAQLYQQSAQAAGIPLQIDRVPDDGYWSDVWNKAPFCASYWGGRPVQDQMYATAYLSDADWNDTRFNDPEFDKLLYKARAELDNDKRKAIYSKMAYMVRDEGGLILPMFNDFIDGLSNKVAGWVPNGNAELMNGMVMTKCWFA